MAHPFSKKTLWYLTEINLGCHFLKSRGFYQNYWFILWSNQRNKDGFMNLWKRIKVELNCWLKIEDIGCPSGLEPWGDFSSWPRTYPRPSRLACRNKKSVLSPLPLLPNGLENGLENGAGLPCGDLLPLVPNLEKAPPPPPPEILPPPRPWNPAANLPNPWGVAEASVVSRRTVSKKRMAVFMAFICFFLFLIQKKHG